VSDTTASAAPSATEDAAPLPRPRIRTGAALWGLVLIAVASYVLWAAATPERRESVVEAVLTLTPLGWTVVVVIAVGATITLLALAAVIRRLQRPRERE